MDKVNVLVKGTDLAGATLEAIVTQSARRAASDPAWEFAGGNYEQSRGDRWATGGHGEKAASQTA